MKHLGLFEGIGGFSLAVRWMGWETVAWCEWNEFCQKILKQHFPGAQTHGDIDNTDFTKYANAIDIVTGGFPCQPYSQGGKRKGKEDSRHKWPQMLRAISEIQPPWVVGENVHGITNWSGGLVFEEVQADLESQGYQVQSYILPACSKNAPHQRYRVWFIAYNHNFSKARRAGENENPGPEKRLSERDKIQLNSISDSVWWANTNANEYGLQGNIPESQTQGDPDRLLKIAGRENYPFESPICRADDGIPNRVDRIKALGNAIVPQVAFEIFKTIEQYEQLNKQKI